MSALLRLALAQARRRRVQSAVVAAVTLLATGTGGLALSLRSLSDAPYDRAFEAQLGAHLVMVFAPGAVSSEQLANTAHLSRVAAAGGPWQQANVALQAGSAAGCDQSQAAPAGPGKGGAPGGCQLRRFDGSLVVARGNPGGGVDVLDVVAGRWPARPGEIALRQLVADAMGVGVGDTVTVASLPRQPQLTVTALVAGVDESVRGWVAPSGMAALASAKAPPDLRMEYRLHDASSTAAVDAARAQVAATLPAHSVEGATSWLDVQRQQDLTVAVMAPFLLAFSVLGMGAVFLIVVNVVGGAVVAGRRDIGVMKAVGFTPAGVSGVLATSMLLPALAGTLAGAPLGVLASQPLLAKAAEGFGLPYHFGVSATSIAAVCAAMLATVALATVFPAWRAGRSSAAEALSSGLAPRSGAAAWLWRRIASLHMPRPLALGVADSVVRPARSAVTAVAVVAGVAAVVFAIGLTASLSRVEDTSRGPANAGMVADIAPDVEPGQAETALRALHGVTRVTAANVIDASVAGVVGSVRVDAWRDDASWLGYDLVAGHWLTGPDQVVISSQLQRSTGLQLGDRLVVHVGDATVDPVITGVLFTASDTSTVHVTAATMQGLFPAGTPTVVDAALSPGADANAAAQAGRAIPGVDVQVRGENVDTTAFAIIEGVLVMLTVIVTAVAALGVFNTVVLSTRERQRHLAILRAIGMEPRQVMVMVVTGTVALGVVAGAAAIPLGIALHRSILGAMADIAGSAVPAQLYGVYSAALLPLLALAGAGIAVAGAVVPARWVSRRPVSDVLRAE